MDTDDRPPNERRPARKPKESPPTDEASSDGRRRRGNRHHVFRGKNRMRQGPREQASAAPTSAEMRAARASGRTPGLSTAYEPAAAPLGTDDEAAGTPPRGADLELEVKRAESGAGMQGLRADEAMSGRPGHLQRSVSPFGKLAAIAAAVLILAAVAMLLF